jgi:hypothetical protein
MDFPTMEGTMLRRIAALAALALTLGLVHAAAQSVEVKVPAKSLWRKTGITVQAGDVIAISASGKWSWDGVTMVGPDGDPADDFNAFDLFQPFDFFSQARLIAYIGDFPLQKHWGDGSYFPQMSGYFSIGSGQTFTAPYGGKLWLGFNDAAVTQSSADNFGFVRAQIAVKAPGTTGPAIAIASPSGVYGVGQSVQVQYSCSKDGGAIVSCTGAVANGGLLDTSVADHYAFTVVAVDDQGNTSSATSTYVVADASSSAVWPTGGVFGPTMVGGKTMSKAFYLTNPQSTAMNISGISIGGDVSGEFSIPSTTCGASLSAHRSCRINVIYRPQNATTARAELDVAADFPAVPVPLWGNGVNVRAMPGSLVFADQGVGTGSAGQIVTVQNKQNAMFTIKDVQLTGDFVMAPDSTCAAGGKVKMGKSCTVDVVFTPTTPGPRTGTLIVHGLTEMDPVAILLGGTGVP